MIAEGRRIYIRGTVQGVGFRPWVVRLARRLGVHGGVWNDAAGVVIDAFGEATVLDRFVDELEAHPPPAARLTAFSWVPLPPAQPMPDFDIRESAVTQERRVTVPPDLPTCEDCLAEVRDPANRRFGYAFTNCTSCGPRYTIVRELPYDRPGTTMASFRMCPDCQREYDDLEDRRFHAQPNACPVCGPRLWLVDSAGVEIESPDPIASTAAALLEGHIVAVKGLGGFHLVVDATREDGIQRLRDRKRRDEKPLAVMVRDLEAARVLAHLGAEEEALLAGVERPIVLVRRRIVGDAAGGRLIAPGVSPGLRRVGLMLPYTPLHHLLLEAVGRPLVMTSGNLSDEPIARTNDEALERLSSLADLLLLHDREIEARADDSVAQVVGGVPQLIRRSRGYVSRGTPLPTPLSRPVLSCGALLKNTFCLASGDAAYLSAHVGDLENVETFTAFEEGVARMERLLRITPALVAHDLHPEYLSTAYARGRPEPKIAVQHHHAHVVSAMVSHGLGDQALGLAWDGTGLGTDGKAWGSELLLARYGGFERLATFRGVPLAGGDKAVREVWRIALALLDDAFDGEPPLERLGLFEHVACAERDPVRQLIAAGLNAPVVHGAGRYFDAVGALVLGRRAARYEGQVAMALEQCADPLERAAYLFELDASGTPTVVDLRPAIRGIVHDLIAGRRAGVVAARFHNTLVQVAVELVLLARERFGDLPVVLTGGCFQNARLALGVVEALPHGAAVYLQGEVPAGDGGLSLGQAVIADAIAQRTE